MSDRQSGSIPRSFIDDLLARSDLVHVIGQRVPLKKAGVTYKACCPFHSEKTPSFNVNPTKQFYHCFGCGAHGDALSFLMDYDGLSFVEAVEQLAALSGLPVPRERLSPAQAEKQKLDKDLYELSFEAAKFFRHQLRDHPSSESAKHYLRDRGLTAEIAKVFMIGFAPPGWSALTDALAENPQYLKQLIEVGLLAEKAPDRRYDRFRNRIMFPIRDGRGRVIAFGGRVLDSEDQPKYLNSPESPIFHKSNTLYGLYEMRQSRENPDHVLVVEGYMDVVALAQFGVRNALATLGTAVTEEHLELLFRQVDRIVFCFDGDQAGKKAAWKALQLALPRMTATRSVQFLFLEQGEDPDSTIRKEGVERFRQRVAQSLSLSEFLFKGLESRLSLPLSTPEGRQQLIALVKPYVLNAREAMPDLLTEALSERVGIPVWRLGQVMGVKVSSKSTGKTKEQTVRRKYEVAGVVIRLYRILLSNPSWGIVFDDEMLEGLKASDKADERQFAQFITYLQKSEFVLPEKVTFFEINAEQRGLFDQIMKMPLQEDEAIQLQEFEALTLELATRLQKRILRRQLAESGEKFNEWKEMVKQNQNKK